MTIRKHVTIERDGVIEIEIRDPALSAGQEAEVDVTVQESGGGLSYDPTARPIWDLAAEITQPAEPSSPPKRRSLTQRILEIGASVPLEDWDKLPRDLSMQADHYLYGSPRKED